jgi:hypothetical protein
MYHGCAYRVLVVKPEKRRPFERPVSKLEGNSKINFNEMDFF